MGFTRKIKYYLVHHLNYSNKAAQQLLENKVVEVDGCAVDYNCLIDNVSEIKVHGEVKRKKKELVYLKFNKPAGFESTLNKHVESTLADFFSEYTDLSIAGRLDKQSQGLLLLSNDGQWVEQLCNPKFEKEKKYLVELDKDVDDVFLRAFEAGVQLGNYLTKPCQCSRTEEQWIQVVLTEGKNRQIRRMCKILGRQVVSLKRIAIATIQLDHLEGGRFERMDPESLQ